MSKKSETIVLSVKEFETISSALDNVEDLNHPEFFHEDISDLIKDEEYGIAGIKLLELQDKIDAQQIIYKINNERKKGAN
jgi:hypothetical protein